MMWTAAVESLKRSIRWHFESFLHAETIVHCIVAHAGFIIIIFSLKKMISSFIF